MTTAITLGTRIRVSTLDFDSSNGCSNQSSPATRGSLQRPLWVNKVASEWLVYHENRTRLYVSVQSIHNQIKACENDKRRTGRNVPTN